MLGTIVVAVLLLLRKTLVLYAFDPVHAHAIGINPRGWRCCCSARSR